MFSSLSDLEVKWNPFSLPNKTLYAVKNSRLAEEYLYKFFETKHPDFRARVVWDHTNSTVEIGSRVDVYATEVKNLLRPFGLKKVFWQQNKLINQMRDKVYGKVI